jgi:uncharacterized membrane protein HdeD (DUF308 family)
MSGWSWKLGRIAGIDVHMRGTFLILLAWVLSVIISSAVASWTPAPAWFSSWRCSRSWCFTSSATHSPRGTTAFARATSRYLPIGGVARLERMPDDPKQEVLVAFAGPLVNVALAAVLFMLAPAATSPATMGEIQRLGGDFLGKLAWVTLASLVLLYGGYALVDGVFNVIAALSGRSEARPWWTMLLAGLVSIAAGLVTFLWPGLTAIALVYVVAAWAIARGVFEIAAAVRLRKVITSEWWLGLSGALSIILGALLMLVPGAGAVAMVLWIGSWAIIAGVVLVALGVRLRGLRHEAPARLRHAA